MISEESYKLRDDLTIVCREGLFEALVSSSGTLRLAAAVSWPGWMERVNLSPPVRLRRWAGLAR